MWCPPSNCLVLCKHLHSPIFRYQSPMRLRRNVLTPSTLPAWGFTVKGSLMHFPHATAVQSSDDEDDNFSPTSSLIIQHATPWWRRRSRYICALLVLLLMLMLLLANSSFPSSSQRLENSRHRSACLDYPEDCRKTAPFVFDAVYSLLKQWPNTYAPNGHSIVAASVPPNTQLYHARPDGKLPKVPTFFAFDAYVLPSPV